MKNVKRFVLLVAVVLGVAGVGVGCTTETKELPKGPPREIRIVNMVELQEDDRTLDIRYWGTECEQFSDVEVEYGTTQVEIAVYALVTTEDCQRSGQQHTTVVTLLEPLAGRILIDANINEVILQQ